MIKWTGPKRRLAFLSLALLFSLSIAAVVLSKKKQEPKTQKRVANTYRPELANTLPQVSSKVKGLEIASVRFARQGTPEAALVIDIANRRDQPVVALELRSGDDNDSSDLGIDGLVDPSKPQVIIPPYGVKATEWNLGAILKDYPVVISAATFADGKEEGEASSLELMHNDRKVSKARREKAAANKGGNHQ